MKTIKKNKYIEIVITPIGDMNIMSPETCEEIYKVLNRNFKKVEKTVIEKKEDLEKLVLRKPDLVFSGIKYVGFTKDSTHRESPKKIWLADYLDSKGMNYTGSRGPALKVEFQKDLAKKLMQKNNINTAPFFIAKPGKYIKKLPLPFPLFIKPIYEGNGKGIDNDSVVTDFKSYEKKIKTLYKNFKTPSLVSKYLSGREFTVGILESQSGKKTVANPVEIISNTGNEYKILSFEVKKEDKEKLIPVKNKKEYKEISKFAIKAFKALGGRDFGRIDIRMDENSKFNFLEANLIPGLNPKKSYFIKTCKRNMQINFEKAILTIVGNALKRSP